MITTSTAKREPVKDDAEELGNCAHHSDDNSNDSNDNDNDNDNTSRTTNTKSKSHHQSTKSLDGSNSQNSRKSKDSMASSHFEINCSPVPVSRTGKSYYEETRLRRKQQQKQQLLELERHLEQAPLHLCESDVEGIISQTVQEQEDNESNHIQPHTHAQTQTQTQTQTHTHIIPNNDDVQAENDQGENDDGDCDCNGDADSCCTLVDSGMSFHQDLGFGSESATAIDANEIRANEDPIPKNTTASIDSDDLDDCTISTSKNGSTTIDTNSFASTCLTSAPESQTMNNSSLQRDDVTSSSYSTLRSVSSAVSRGEEHISSRMKKYGLYNLHEMKRKSLQRKANRRGSNEANNNNINNNINNNTSAQSSVASIPSDPSSFQTVAGVLELYSQIVLSGERKRVEQETRNLAATSIAQIQDSHHRQLEAMRKKMEAQKTEQKHQRDALEAENQTLRQKLEMLEKELVERDQSHLDMTKKLKLTNVKLDLATERAEANDDGSTMSQNTHPKSVDKMLRMMAETMVRQQKAYHGRVQKLLHNYQELVAEREQMKSIFEKNSNINQHKEAVMLESFRKWFREEDKKLMMQERSLLIPSSPASSVDCRTDFLKTPTSASITPKSLKTPRSDAVPTISSKAIAGKKPPTPTTPTMTKKVAPTTPTAPTIPRLDKERPSPRTEPREEPA